MSRFAALNIALVLSFALAACAPQALTVPAATPAPISDHSVVPQTTVPAAGANPSPLADLSQLSFITSGWKTDFAKHTVPLAEISSGGPPRDGIPPIDQPKFQSVAAVDWLKDGEPVVAFEQGGEARAYPLQILIWHEIVNDVVAGTPIAVTFCPLCNTAIAFDRRVERLGTLRFGTTGNLRYSDLVMWDDATESWWQQVSGEAIVGTLAGTRLRVMPAQIVGFAQFKAAFPRGQVLTRATGYVRDYGSNPYVGYDDVSSSPFLYTGPSDGRLRPMARVVTVSLAGEDVAYPFDTLAAQRAVHDIVGGTPIVIFHQPGATSALDSAQIASSRDVGAGGVFRPLVQGRPLSFSPSAAGFRDAETGSTWNVLGHAIAGPLAGSHLEPVEHANHFWFAWAAFKPGTRIWHP